MSNAKQFHLRKIEYLIPIIGMLLIGITSAAALITSRQMTAANEPLVHIAKIMGALKITSQIEAVIVLASLVWCVLRWSRTKKKSENT